jgi:hypothetical protein
VETSRQLDGGTTGPGATGDRCDTTVPTSRELWIMALLALGWVAVLILASAFVVLVMATVIRL